MTEEKKEPVEKQLTIEDIEIYKPNNANINYHGEWIMKLGAFVYGIIIRKKDNKMLVTYNIDPDNIHADHFTLIDENLVPAKVYTLLKSKIMADVARLDSMMFNIIRNKSLLSTYMNFAEKFEATGAESDYEVLEYTDQDAQADKALENEKLKNRSPILNKGKAQRKSKVKAQKKARKNNRKK